jgi:carotenoid cleavage dioxygenase-like enzyme
MKDNFEPVPRETTAYDLPATGVIPSELHGRYLRNGPNPRGSSAHWFLGEGMIHGVRLSAGRAEWYRSRWVDSPEHGLANTHVVHHAGRTFALVESHRPVEISDDLDVIGPYDFDGRLDTAMTAHPKTCPETGELHFFGAGETEPFLTYHRADRDGNLTVSRPIEVPAGTMMHDFHLTGRYVVFMDLPVVYRPDAPGMPYRWSDEYGARLGVLRRDDPYGPVRWLEIDPCYVFHTLNAYDTGDSIVAHVVRYPHLFRGDDRPDGALWRWTIDLAAGRVREEPVDDRTCEFPRIDDRLAGADAGHGHVTAARDPGAPSALIRYDLHRGTSVTHEFGPGRVPDEAAFVPRADGPGGWLMTYVFDAGTGRSDLVLLDADDLTADPVATVHLPARVPFGFHGNWIDDGA